MKEETNEKNGQGASFEEAMSEADQIVRELEDGSLPLSDSLQKYERGVKLLGQCFKMLEQAELKISQLAGIDAQGRPVTEQFECDPNMPLEEKSRSRGRRRMPKQPSSPTQREAPPEAADGFGAGRQNQQQPESVDESKGLF